MTRSRSGLRGRRHARGFTLLEVLVAFALLAIALTLLLGTLSGAARQVGQADARTRAVLHAQSLLASVGIAGSYWSVLLPVIINPFGIFLCRVFAAAAVPDDTLEAARLDGASEVRIFGAIALPMMSQGLVTVFLLQFVGIWNNFLLPFIMLSDQSKYPVTLGLYTFLSKGAGDSDLYPLVIMGSAVSIIPLIILLLVLQRFWRADLLAGGLKG